MIRGIHHPSVHTVDLDRLRAFYQQAFGFEPVGDTSTRPLKAYDIGYTHLCVQVSDIDQEYLRLSALGMRFVSPAPVHFAGLASVYGFDPDGNIIEIAEFSSDNPLSLPLGNSDLRPLSA